MDPPNPVTHCRDLTLERLVETLGAVKGVGGVKHVVRTKVWSSDVDDLGILAVYFANEVLAFKSGRIKGQRVVQRTMNFFAVSVAAKPVRMQNALEADQGLVMDAVERALAADTSLASGGIPLLSDLFYTQGGTGYDAESSGVTVALAAMSIVAVAHHLEGRPDVTLPQASF